jgi:hypothetical protein
MKPKFEVTIEGCPVTRPAVLEDHPLLSVAGRQAAHNARRGDWGQLVDRLRSRAALTDAEYDALIDLFDGKNAVAKVKIDKRRTPRAEDPRRLDVVNFVLMEMYSGHGITTAVQAAEIEFNLERSATIWDWLKEDVPSVFQDDVTE